MRLNALWWWIDRWRKSTAYTDMTLQEQGAYRNLLDEATLRGGPLPTDERILARACGDAKAWKRVRPKVIAHFTLTSDGWRNATLDSVLARSEELRVARSTAGREGGRAKASKAGKEPSKEPSKPVANEVANGLAKTWHPSPSPSPDNEEQKIRTPAAPERPPVAKLTREPADDGNYRVILKLAHEVMEVTAQCDPSDADLVEALKSACARRRIDYSAPRVIARALGAAAHARMRSVSPLAANLRTAGTPAALGARLKALAVKASHS